jgi:hypothetical protein
MLIESKPSGLENEAAVAGPCIRIVSKSFRLWPSLSFEVSWVGVPRGRQFHITLLTVLCVSGCVSPNWLTAAPNRRPERNKVPHRAKTRHADVALSEDLRPATGLTAAM